eukprot:10843994-Ditylum_brightwellii.AAC.1
MEKALKQQLANKRLQEKVDPSLPIETLFSCFGMVQDLSTAGNSPYTDNQLMNIAFDLVFSNGVHNDTCKEWLQVPAANPQAGYTANSVNADYLQEQGTDAIACLVEATKADRITVTNLSTTNQTLLDQVANMTAQMSAKDDKITELMKSVEQLNITICAFTNICNTNGGSDRKPGKKKKGKGGPIAIFYCWTCGVNTTHAEKGCTCKKH